MKHTLLGDDGSLLLVRTADSFSANWGAALHDRSPLSLLVRDPGRPRPRAPSCSSARCMRAAAEHARGRTSHRRGIMRPGESSCCGLHVIVAFSLWTLGPCLCMHVASRVRALLACARTPSDARQRGARFVERVRGHCLLVLMQRRWLATCTPHPREHASCAIDAHCLRAGTQFPWEPRGWRTSRPLLAPGHARLCIRRTIDDHRSALRRADVQRKQMAIRKPRADAQRKQMAIRKPRAISPEWLCYLVL